MQTIKTKILPSTNTKPTRIKAISASGLSVTISRSCNSLLSSDHMKAAYKLKMQLGWTDKMIGGHTKDGMIFVFHSDNYIIQ